MNFRHLRAFVAVAEELSFTKAAQRLHMSQPPLSRQIQQLEREVGVQLFVRRPRRIELTERGRLLLDEARQLSAIADEFLDRAQRVKRTSAGVIRVGIDWGLWNAVNAIRAHYSSTHAGVDIVAEDLCAWLSGYSVDPADAFRRQRIDVALTRAPVETPGMTSEVLFDEHIAMLVSEHHPLARARGVRLRQFRDETLLMFDRHISPVLYDTILELYTAAGITPRIVHTRTRPVEQAGLIRVAAGEGIHPWVKSPFTQPHAAKGVVDLRLLEPRSSIAVLLTWRIDEVSSAVTQFVMSARQVYARHASDRARRTAS